MLNSPCLHPHVAGDPSTSRANLDQLVAYYRSRAKCNRAAAANSFGWVREAYEAEAEHYEGLADSR